MLTVTVTAGQTYDGKQARKDCAARAIMHYFDVPYLEAVDLLQAHTDFHPNRGVTTWRLRKLLEDMGMVYIPARVRLTARDPLSKLPPTAILQFGRHAAAMIDGTIYDTFHTIQSPRSKQTVGYYVEASSHYAEAQA